MARGYRRAAAVIADSHFSAGEIRALTGRADVHVVYPGVDERFARIVRAPAAEPVALVVGTVERRKNLVRAVETVAAIPELRLIAIGPFTPYADEVRARIVELGVAERVELRGFVERAEADRLYATATLALVPSRYEGFGYALAEARCAGLPVIAARSSSLVEVADGAVTLIDPDDGAGWIDATRALLAARERAERDAAAGRAHASARFAWSMAAEGCRAVYRAVGGSTAANAGV